MSIVIPGSNIELPCTSEELCLWFIEHDQVINGYSLLIHITRLLVEETGIETYRSASVQTIMDARQQVHDCLCTWIGLLIKNCPENVRIKKSRVGILEQYNTEHQCSVCDVRIYVCDRFVCYFSYSTDQEPGYQVLIDHSEESQ